MQYTTKITILDPPHFEPISIYDKHLEIIKKNLHSDEIVIEIVINANVKIWGILEYDVLPFPCFAFHF